MFYLILKHNIDLLYLDGGAALYETFALRRLQPKFDLMAQYTAPMCFPAQGRNSHKGRRTVLILTTQRFSKSGTGLFTWTSRSQYSSH